MKTRSLTALALILSALPALAQEAAVDAEAKAAIAADEARTDEIDESDALLAAEQDGALGTEDLNAAALSVLKNEIPETTGATPEVVEEIDAIVAKAEAMVEEMEAEDVAEAADPEEIEELEEAAEEIEEVLAEVGGDDAPAMVAKPGDGQVVKMDEKGPQVTKEVAPTAPEVEETLGADTTAAPKKPVMRDTDKLVMEPLVNQIGVDDGKTVEVKAAAAKTAAAPADTDKPTNAELNAKLAELDNLLSGMEAEQAAQAEAQKLEMEIEAEMDELDAEIDALDAEVAALDAETTEIDAPDATSVEIEDTVTMAADGTKARKTMVIMTDANGDTTITQNAKAPLATMDAVTAGNAKTKVKVLVKKLDGADDQVNIEASGATVTESVTPDGSTRIIRVSPENGDKGTLITITKG